MFGFIGRRLLVAIPTMFLVVTVAFFMMRAAPGSPFDLDRRLSPEIEQNVKAKYGLDKPIIAQYGDYVVGALHGDFGPSLKYKDKTVLQILQENYKVSLILGASAMIFASVVGMSLGVMAALRQNDWVDYGVMGVAVMGVCIPAFVTAPLLVLIFGSLLQWLPNGGWNGGAIQNLILPVFVLSLPQIAIISRFTRAGMVEVLTSNYVRATRSRTSSITTMPCGPQYCPWSIILALPAPGSSPVHWWWKRFSPFRA